MDKILMIAAINQSVQQAEKKSTPLEITNVNKANLALGGKFIGESTEQEVKERLKRIYAMIGLRPHHFPVDEEKQFLHDFIFVKYSRKTLDELVLAFELALDGQLDVEDVKVYDQFTCEYLARIMNGYRNWLKNVSAIEATKKKPVAFIDNKRELTFDEIQEWVNEWKAKEKIELDLIPLTFYEFLVGNGSLVVSNEKKWEYIQKATVAIKVGLHEEMNTCKTNNAYNLFRDFERMEKDGFEGEMKGRILNKAKRLLIHEYLKG
jgi:hypothetical protein